MKDTILEILRSRIGEYISGEELSKQLKVSRTSIWKHIGALRGEGYIIDSQPKQGYRFISAPDLLLPREIRGGLAARIFGRQKIIYSEKVDSTNDIAKALASKGATEGTIVLAEQQIKGRGRRGRWWDSPFGVGIYLSIILRPKVNPREAPKITVVFGVAAAFAIEKLTSLKPRIKWPNDLLISGKKVGGILTEMSAEMDGIDYVVVGLGLNVNNPRSSFPKEIKGMASSLKEELGRPICRVTLLQCLLGELEFCYQEFVDGNFSSILARWRELTDTLGRLLEVDTFGRRVAGEAIDIDENGALILKDKDGNIHRIIAGDILYPVGKQQIL
jgi:BirA family biotin operon repressor/biotin-[acetyl-CoA-carboxylase] ligase